MTPLLPRVGSRRWIAWKLVQLAYRIFDADYYERIYIRDADGHLTFEAIISADLYGAGVSSIYGGVGSSLGAGSTVHWDDDYKPDWLDEE
ncbi:hypothetical protein FHT44_004960 [Mycolicibacterium sp. BK634]|uniref:hypothetical protein n=1 Tax=Mycolicibacterium sp. BK634 TaxID=2587099 RepID=UPI0017F3C525|nr:hypothetical protein [Mycolicibacterium sp. BK634]MBB3752448.1 hypothetical protein [Mycolicibacterium sp. BK634]